MIYTPTTLVLGAGASMPYGFPSGRKLIELIITMNLSERNKFVQLGINSELLIEFQKDLMQADSLSIDEFLETRHEDYLEIGKSCIAYLLIQKEYSDTLFRRWKGPEDEDHAEKWYYYLMDELTTFVDDNGATKSITLDQFSDNKLSVVTFNYDRSLEHYFFTTLSKRFNAPKADVANVVQKIPIIHIHGQIGFLNWQSRLKGAPVRSYNRKLDKQTLKTAADCIQILFEADDEDSTFSRAQGVMNDAERVYFLGFGYHPENMRRMKMHKFRPQAQWWKPDRIFKGSCSGFTDEEKRLKLSGRCQPVKFGDVNHKILEFLRRDGNFLKSP